MLRSREYAHVLRVGCEQCFFALAVLLLCSGAVAAQNLPAATTGPASALPVPALPLKATFPLVSPVKAVGAVPTTSAVGQSYSAGLSLGSNSSDAAGARRITLEEAQEAAAGAGNPLVRLGQLSVEAAKQHREGVQGLYFPNVERAICKPSPEQGNGPSAHGATPNLWDDRKCAGEHLCEESDRF